MHCPCPMQRLDPRLLTGCQDLGALGRVVAPHGHAFNYIHVPAALMSFQGLVQGSIRPGGPAAALMATLACLQTPRPRHLNSMITNCRSLEALGGLVAAHGYAFDYIHIPSALMTFQKLARGPVRPGGPAAIMAQLVTMLRQKAPELGAQGVSNSLYALAQLEHDGDLGLVSALIARGATLS